MAELTDEMMLDIFSKVDGAENPTEILIPKSIIDEYGIEAIEELLNEA